MRRFLFRCGALLCAALLVVSGAIVIARAQPESGALAALGFEWCGALPCVRGLQPGQTRFRQVPELLGSGVRRRSLTEMSLAINTGDIYIIAGDEIPDNETRVLLVHLSPPTHQSLAEAGEYVQQYGPPCGVIPVTASSLKLLYPAMELGVTVSDGYLRVGSPVYSVTMYSQGLKCARRAAYAWAGFTSMAQYSAQVDAK